MANPRSKNTAPVTPAAKKLADELAALPDPEQARLFGQLERGRRWQAENRALREQIGALQRQLDLFTTVASARVKPYAITPTAKIASEATAIALASDWHIEERVDPRTVNNQNEYDLEISQARAKRYFQHLVRLFHLSRREVEIPTIVLGLLGDFFTNSLIDEMLENNLLLPIDAAIRVEADLLSGIRFMLAETRQLGTHIHVLCHSGNHARVTDKQHITTEAGNSIEYLIYHMLARAFVSEPRITFDIPRGYHTYLPVYDVMTRWHHGHKIKYFGGVGGITIPTLKAIAQWNRAQWADIDFFGHLHTQLMDAGPFCSNGSLIGYSAQAIAWKAGYERPQQAFVLIDKKRGPTGRWPILVAEDA